MKDEEKDTGRIEAFSDGVFAIAITLLALELKIPHTVEGGEEGLVRALISQWPSYLSFVTSFCTILIMWGNHHEMFRHVRRVNTGFMLSNGFLLMLVTVIVTFVIAWAPRCEAGPEIRPVSGMGYAVFATGLAGPRGLLFSRSGDLFAAEQSGGTVVRITPDGRVSRIAKGFSAPHDLAFDAFGYLYVADTGANRVARVSPEGSVTAYIAGLNVPVDLAFHPNGELFVCELYAGTVTAYESGKKVKLVASGLDKPHGLAFDNTGITYINEWSGNRILKMDRKGRLQPVATVENPVGVAIGKSGDLYVAQPQAGKVSRVKMDGTRIILIEGLDEPRDPAFDEAGNLFVAETGAGRILKMKGDY